MTEELEEKGIKIESLNAEEKQTYFSMLDVVNDAQLTPEKLRDYIINMKNAVAEELTKVDLTNAQDLFLKARLKNYILLESFLLSPEKAKKQLEDMIAGMVSKSAI